MRKWRTDLQRDGGGADAPARPGRRAVGRSGAPRSPRLVWLIVPVVLAIAFVGALLVARVIDRDPAEEPARATAAGEAGDGTSVQAETVQTTAPAGGVSEVAGTSTSVLVRRPEVALRGAPGMRIHPQRAEAGAPLEVQVEGEGCPGAGGTLSVTEVGSAQVSGGPDRLVVRRRFDVDEQRRFFVTPLLVGQPPGTYRVAVACDRTARAVALDAGRERRDTFVMSELLELVGPAMGRDLEVVPAFATPGVATTVEVTARSCPGGAQARVEASVFPPNVGVPPSTVALQPVPEGGAWRASFVVPAEAAVGSYTVEARCYDALGVLFPYATRTVRFGPPPADELAPPATSRLRGVLSALIDVVAPPPRAISGVPNYTG